MTGRLRCAVLLVLATAMLACSSGDLVVGRRNPSDIARRSSSIPIGIENVNDSPMKATAYRALLRFVPDRTIEIDRLYFGFKVRGADCWDPGLAGNGAGDGGTLGGSLVNIDPKTGLPGAMIAEETVNACVRHDEAVAELGGVPVLVWVNVRAILSGGAMYGLIVKNAHPEPANHFFSFQAPIADTVLAGPQARNELSATAPGAVMSLDPREHVAWSADGGVSWLYGSDNGQYPSYMNDDDLAHPATRVPQYGFRLTDGSMLAAQPYYAYKTDCVGCTVVYASARFTRTFTELGGFTASGPDVGTLTITNVSTGAESACSPAPGYGFRTCTLPQPVSVAQGEDCSIRASGSVELMRMDNAQRALFPSVGTPSGDHRAYQPNPAPGTNAKDVPSLWAGPLSAHVPAPDEK